MHSTRVSRYSVEQFLNFDTIYYILLLYLIVIFVDIFVLSLLDIPNYRRLILKESIKGVSKLSFSTAVALVNLFNLFLFPKYYSNIIFYEFPSQ